MRMKNRFQSVNHLGGQELLKSVCEGMPGMGFTVHNEADEMTIHVMGIIGDGFDGLDSATLVPRIRAARGVPITMILDTPGGNVFDAVAIYSTLVEHDATVRVDIVGQAASGGTILTAAADNIRIAPAGEYMLHSAWIGVMLMGNARELEEQVKGVSVLIDRLDKIDAELDQVIALRSGLTLEEVHDFTVGPEGADGTTFTGVEAVEHGFADELLPRKVKPEDPAKAARSEFSVALRARAMDIARMRAKVVAGPKLASLLSNAVDRIDSSESDGRSRADVIGEMASAAGIGEGAVNSILTGEIECPPLDRLRGFATVSGIPSLSSQRTAAEGDGCSYASESD